MSRLLLGILFAVALSTPAAHAAAPSPQLVYMREDTGQIWATVSVSANGAGDVGFFVGEVNGVGHHAFRLPAGGLAKLRPLVTQLRTLRGPAYVGASPSAAPFDRETVYTLETGSRAVDTAEGHMPARLQGLVTYLSDLIARYSPVASSAAHRTSS
jgi:hypothetical protein